MASRRARTSDIVVLKDVQQDASATPRSSRASTWCAGKDETTCIIGGSGAGKTTLLRLIVAPREADERANLHRRRGHRPHGRDGAQPRPPEVRDGLPVRGAARLDHRPRERGVPARRAHQARRRRAIRKKVHRQAPGPRARRERPHASSPRSSRAACASASASRARSCSTRPSSSTTSRRAGSIRSRAARSTISSTTRDGASASRASSSRTTSRAASASPTRPSSSSKGEIVARGTPAELAHGDERGGARLHPAVGGRRRGADTRPDSTVRPCANAQDLRFAGMHTAWVCRLRGPAPPLQSGTLPMTLPMQSQDPLAPERDLREALDRVSDGFVVYARDWRMLYLNRAAEKYFGRPREELLGRIVWEAFPAAAGTDAERYAAARGRARRADRHGDVRAGHEEAGLASASFHRTLGVSDLVPRRDRRASRSQRSCARAKPSTGRCSSTPSTASS